MNEQNCIKCQQLEEQQKEDKDNGVGIGTTDEAALQSKNARLGAKVEMLEDKLEKQQQELNAKINLLTEELRKVKEENGVLGKKLEDTEQKAEMAKNELEEIIQTSRQKLEVLVNEIALLREQQKEGTNSLAQIEKELSPCLRLLPLETWTDIFGFLPRPQLGELVPEIGDWHFAAKAQYYLHECGRITLGDLFIRRPTSWIDRKNGRPIVKLCYDDDYEHQYFGWHFPWTDVPIPKNITNFEGININYFNESVLGFMQEFHRNSLLTNVDLCFVKAKVNSNAIRQIVPLLTSINKLNLFYIDIEALIQKEYSARMLASARILFIHYKLDDGWYSRWLCTPREDGKPRILILGAFADRSIFAFIEHIKKAFMDSSEAASFFIYLRNFPNANNVHSESLKNNKTSERLVINGKDQPCRHVTIARYPMQATEEWIQEMGKYFDSVYRTIDINI